MVPVTLAWPRSQLCRTRSSGRAEIKDTKTSYKFPSTILRRPIYPDRFWTAPSSSQDGRGEPSQTDATEPLRSMSGVVPRPPTSWSFFVLSNTGSLISTYVRCRWLVDDAYFVVTRGSSAIGVFPPFFTHVRPCVCSVSSFTMYSFLSLFGVRFSQFCFLFRKYSHPPWYQK